MSTSKSAKAAVAPMRQRTQENCVRTSGHKGIDWDQQPLGQMSDVTLSKKLGVTSAAVRKARIKRGISTVFQNRWRTEPLGDQTDQDLADSLGVSRRTLSRVRAQRGIHGPQTINWSQQPLGKVTDMALGRLLGVNQSSVSTARRLRGIPRADLICRTAEGEPATYPEALIDLYWHEKGVEHDFQFKVGPYVADWLIEGTTLVEYAGFQNHRKLGTAYWERLTKKLWFYAARGWLTKVLTPDDLDQYDLGRLPVFEGKRRACMGCQSRFGVDRGPLGGVKKHKAKGLCKSCYTRSRR